MLKGGGKISVILGRAIAEEKREESAFPKNEERILGGNKKTRWKGGKAVKKEKKGKRKCFPLVNS